MDNQKKTSITFSTLKLATLGLFIELIIIQASASNLTESISTGVDQNASFNQNPAVNQSVEERLCRIIHEHRRFVMKKRSGMEIAQSNIEDCKNINSVRNPVKIGNESLAEIRQHTDEIKNKFRELIRVLNESKSYNNQPSNETGTDLKPTYLSGKCDINIENLQALAQLIKKTIDVPTAKEEAPNCELSYDENEDCDDLLLYLMCGIEHISFAFPQDQETGSQDSAKWVNAYQELLGKYNNVVEDLERSFLNKFSQQLEKLKRSIQDLHAKLDRVLKAVQATMKEVIIDKILQELSYSAYQVFSEIGGIYYKGNYLTCDLDLAKEVLNRAYECYDPNIYKYTIHKISLEAYLFVLNFPLGCEKIFLFEIIYNKLKTQPVDEENVLCYDMKDLNEAIESYSEAAISGIERGHFVFKYPQKIKTFSEEAMGWLERNCCNKVFSCSYFKLNKHYKEMIPLPNGVTTFFAP